MPCFHLNLTGLKWAAVDEEGAEFESLEHAYLEAFRSAQEVWGELLLQREDPRACAFEITGGDGTLLMTVPLTEVLDACRKSQAPTAPKPRVGPVRRTSRGPRSRRPEPAFAAFGGAVADLVRMRRLASEMAEQLQRTRAALAVAKELIEESDRVQTAVAYPRL